MKITNQNINKNFLNINSKKQDSAPTQVAQQSSVDNVDYSKIAFKAIYNVKQKRVDIAKEKQTLLRQMDNVLEFDVPEKSETEIVMEKLNKAIHIIQARYNEQERIMDTMESVARDKRLNVQQKLDALNALKKQINVLDKITVDTPKKKASKNNDEKIDYLLVNKFRNEIAKDNFNLRKVYQEYYKNLDNIDTVSELNKKYPKIKTPPNPIDVIAKKVESVLTRDFYEQFDELYLDNKQDELKAFTFEKVKELVVPAIKALRVDADLYIDAISEKAFETITNRYKQAKRLNAIASIPEFKKNKTPQITETDAKLLTVDYDDFVISVIKEHYLNLTKINDIKYSNNNESFPVRMLSATEYKFEKMPEKIKGFMAVADAILSEQRNYDHFSTDELKARLDLYTNSKVADDENILESIIEFESCRFEQEDIQNLIKFLRELDKVQDEKQTTQQAVDNIKRENISAKGTEKLNEIERKQVAERIKAEQQKISELIGLQDKFDDAINLLYFNDMNSTAITCSKYKPESLDSSQRAKAEFLIKTINETLSLEADSESKKRLDSKILKWDTYNLYKNSSASQAVFNNAVQYATKNSELNIYKAGQYILSAEIVENYPKSLNFVENPEILTKIIEKTEGNKEAATEYFCKFDDYQNLSTYQKTHLLEYIDMFDLKNPVDKTILKHIIENDYAKTDTVVKAEVQGANGNTVDVTFASSAKQQIIEKYKFPNCMEYLEGFEDACSMFATERGTSGIKKTGRNNESCKHTLEVKLSGHDDRLFTSTNDYCFDIYSERGLH